MGGDNDMNPESEVNTQFEGFIPDTKTGIETDKKASTLEISEAAIDQATEKVRQENNPIIEMDKVKGLFNSEVNFIKFKTYEFSQNAKEFFKNMTWSKVAKFGSTAALGFVLASCAGKTAEASAPIEPVEIPATEVLNDGGKETQEMEEKVEASMEAPEEEEIPIPDIDLTWSWEDFEGRFRMTPTVEEMEKSFKPEEGKSKYVIFGGTAGKLYDLDKTYPYSKDTLESPNIIKNANDSMGLGLDEKGEEILRQMFLYQLQEGEEIEDQDVFVYIYVENGCPYEKSGPVTVIWQNGTPQVFSKGDIPWDKIPSDVWDDIVAGNTRIDMSGDEVVCSCNVNDIRSSSNSAEE